MVPAAAFSRPQARVGDSTECTPAGQNSQAEPQNPLNHAPGRRPSLENWRGLSEGASTGHWISLGPTSNTGNAFSWLPEPWS